VVQSDLENLDLTLLPSVSLVEWQRLPREAGLYFVQRVATGEMMYIGQSRDCRIRWSAHAALRKTLENDPCQILFFSLPPEDLNEAERWAITHWAPRLNKRPGARVRITRATSTYKKLMLRLPKDVRKACHRIAVKNHRSMHAQILHVLTEWLAQEELIAAPPVQLRLPLLR
jgi:hypothetical protein